MTWFMVEVVLYAVIAGVLAFLVYDTFRRLLS
jgi:Tfp pilus assembly protein PilE